MAALSALEEGGDPAGTGSADHTLRIPPVSQAIYNANFHQIVSGDHAGNVAVWDVDTGVLVSHFTVNEEVEDNIDKGNSAGDHKGAHISSMCFDIGHRRLIVGTHLGKRIYIYNFSNGVKLRTLTKNRKQRVVGTSTSAMLTIEKPVEMMPMAARRTQDIKRRIARRRNLGIDSRSSAKRALGRSAGLQKRTYDGVSEVTVLINANVGAGNTLESSVPLVLACGWDRKIHVWKENEDDGLLQCNRDIPEVQDAGHKDDINAMSFCPPNTVASGCYDGTIIGWNITSGKSIFRHKFNEPIEAMCWMDDMGILAVARSTGSIAFFDTKRGHLLADCERMDGDKATVAVMAVDQHCEHIYLGDSDGNVRVLACGGYSSTGWLHPFSHFRAHPGERITCIDHIEKPTLVENFLVTSALCGRVKLWTLLGICVGVFGQRNPWDILDPSTWRSTRANSVNMLQRVSKRRRSMHHIHRKDTLQTLRKFINGEGDGLPFEDGRIIIIIIIITTTTTTTTITIIISTRAVAVQILRALRG